MRPVFVWEQTHNLFVCPYTKRLFGSNLLNLELLTHFFPGVVNEQIDNLCSWCFTQTLFVLARAQMSVASFHVVRHARQTEGSSQVKDLPGKLTHVCWTGETVPDTPVNRGTARWELFHPVLYACNHGNTRASVHCGWCVGLCLHAGVESSHETLAASLFFPCSTPS